ncbi:MAG: TIGR04076 family protein [Thaumarchaeota archaeon]|nr:MAG: TIGR04076 family protein [Nitrososphaerota archaeon]
MCKVKITVLNKLKNPEALREFGNDLEEECPFFKVGQEFISENVQNPEGFCNWAWADIHKDVAILTFGGNAPWIKREGTIISCCTNGLRPVVFKIERIEE